MAGQPDAASLATYTFDFTTLAITEPAGTPSPSAIVQANTAFNVIGDLVYAGANPLARVALLAAAVASIDVTVVFDELGGASEGVLGTASVAIVAGTANYSFNIPVAAGLPAGLYDIRGAAVVRFGGVPTDDAGHNEIDILQSV